MLDLRLTDTCASFGDLHRTLKLYPNREQWKAGNLSQMILDAAESVRTEARERNGTVSTTPGQEQKLSWKERCLKAEQKVRELEGDLRTLQGRYDQMAENYRELKQLIQRPAS